MKEYLDRVAKLYYEGEPVLTDDEFDALADKYDYKAVGHTITDGVPHMYSMYSLQKCFDIDSAPLSVLECVSTPKLDGAAVSLLYVNGELELALTRGDGIIGRDITDKMQQLVPNIIKYKGVVQITGEDVAPSSVLNSRNFASGSLGLKGLSGLEEFKARPLAFVAYDSSNLYDNYIEEMNWLQHGCGFNVVTLFDCTNYPTDGVVYRLWDGNKFRDLGHTSKHPRGAFALKEQKEGVVTKLLDVVWQVGKSGVVSPVAILEPVMVGDAVVGKATLHNIEYIRGLNLEIGCMVEIIRSGEIIPRIVKRAEDC